MRPEQRLSRLRGMVLFSYSTKHMLKKDKIRFFYALNDRAGKSGILKRCKAEHFGVTVLLVPAKFDKTFQEFFKLWNIPFERIELLVEG